MRHILLALLIGLGLAACAHPADQPVIKSDQFSCQSAQVAGLSEHFSNKLCVQRDILTELDVEGPVLEKATHVILDHPPKGGPDSIGISCILPERQSFTYCAYDGYWWLVTPTRVREAMFPPESTTPYAPFASTGGSAQFAPQ
jgi:hypothetical protein